MWLARTCAGRLVLRDVLLVERRDLGLGHGDRLAHLVDVEQRVLDLALLADAVALLRLLEVPRRVPRRSTVTWLLNASAVTGTTSSFTFSLRLRNSAATSASLTDIQPVSALRSFSICSARRRLLLELRGRHRRILELQDLPVALLADELAVLLEAGQREDALANLDVADRDALLARLGDHGFFVNELLQDLPIDAELLEQLVVHLPAVGVAIGLDLRVVAPRERADRDRLAFDLGQHLARRGAGAGGQEIGDVEDHEGQDDQRQAPFEPALVPPHPVEHRHRRILWETTIVT